MDNQEYVILSEIRDLLRANLEVQRAMLDLMLRQKDASQ
jgi:hypothetical protein